MFFSEKNYKLDNILDGEVILINKPYKWSSFDVVKKIRSRFSKYFNLKRFKVGHAGTLDPLATGLLLICTGKQTKNISEDKSMDHIFGFCIVNDVSEREYQLERSSGQWDKGKAFDTFGPIGPYIVTKDEIKDVQNLNLQLKLNGKIMQKGNTQSMIFGVNHLVSYLSFFIYKFC